MMNFTGQLKKRTVNIGGGFKQNRSSLLQQTQREREKRERERGRERAAGVVKRAVVRRCRLMDTRYQLCNQWDERSIEALDINRVVYWFTIFYSDTFGHNPRRKDQLELLMSKLSLRYTELSQVNQKRLLSTCRDVIPNIDISSSDDLEVAQGMLYIVNSIIPVACHDVILIPTLTKFASRLVPTPDLSVLSHVTDLINRISADEPSEYLKFLLNDFVGDLHSFGINFIALSEQLSKQEVKLDTDHKLQLLINVILKADDSSTWFFTALSWIVSSFDVSLVTASELDDDYESDQEQQEIKYKQKIIDNQSNEIIETLYTRDMVVLASERLQDTNQLTRLLGSLVVLKPRLKSSLMIYLIPTGFEPLLKQVLAHRVFEIFTDMDESALFSVSQDFINEVFKDNLDFLHHDLFVFLELLQYKLIISNDREILLHHDFTRENFLAIAMFLKKFVFNLIWNRASIKSVVSPSKKADMLSDLVMKVLSQVYLKDARLKIMAKDAWLIDPSRLKLGNITTVISQYEEKKNDFTNYSDGEGEQFLESLNKDTQARFEIYQKVPFFISFDSRVEIFQGLVEMDKARLGIGDSNLNFFAGFIDRRYTATIRREHLLDDAFENFGKLGEQFKTKLGIEFVNQYGREEGIDGGGITKEFLTSVVREGFREPLFVENDHHELYPNPQIGLRYRNRIDSSKQLEHLSYLNFMGKVLGKCLYDRVLVDVAFANFFLTKFNSGYKTSFDDLESLDSELYSNLTKLLSLTDDELSNLGLTFSLDELVHDRHITFDLIPKGSTISVTSANRLKFIHEVSNYKLNKTVSLQCNSFLNGLYEMISKEWLAMFNPYELQMLISGETDVNIEDLKENCVYGGYSESDQTIQDLWEIVAEMTSADRFQFVKFVTSVPRAPLLGFKALVPNFGIRNTGSDIDRLPTSSTCVNLLRLPNYRNKQVLKEKLLYAINAEAGFDLA